MSESRPGRVAVLGGGQLGRMMALAGIPLGLEFVFLDPASDACASALGGHVVADFSDVDAVRELAKRVDVATFDFENVPESSARAMAESVKLLPAPKALGACQDRLSEKTLLTGLGVPVPDYHAVASRTDLLEGLDRTGYPAMLKTRRLGYDGKGQALIRDQEDLERAWQQLGDRELILESFVPFQAECSLVAVRGSEGQTAFWPLTRNLHDRGVLALSLAGGLDSSLQARAEDIMRRLLDAFDYTGVLTLEFFVLNGELLVNEIAPRVHNSGHWTIDAAATSQFENHLRAICAMPLGDTRRLQHALMFNWIGTLPQREDALARPGLHWHDYGKAARPGRKLGHATLTASSAETLRSGAEDLARSLGGKWPGLLEKLYGGPSGSAQ
jgi:5-(carboxyamino)imidazole ribonucleotide synthase